MKVLHVLPRLSRGGAAQLVSDLTLAAKSEGIDWHICVLNQSVDVHSERLKKIGIPVFCVGLDQIWRLDGYIRLSRLMKSYDVVHVHLFPTLYIVRFIAFLCFFRGRLVYTEHSTRNRRRKAPFKPLENIVYKGYAKIVAISDPVARHLLNWLPECSGHITTINNAINIKRFSEAEALERDALGVESQAFTILLMVSAFEARKDHDTLIRAMAILPDDYCLVLAGTGSRERVVKQLAIDIGVSSRVKFLGYRSDVERLMKTSDIYVQSSHWEGFGLVAVEAMATGLPVVVSEVEGMKDIVAGVGLTFKLGDHKDLAEKILFASGDKKKLARLSLERAPQFSIINSVHLHHSLYKKLFFHVD